MTPQVKTLMTNIATGAFILGVLVAGYFMFVKKTDTTTPEAAVTVSGVAQAVSVSSNITRTKTELSELKKAVVSSVEVFSSSEFRNLKDFAQQIPEEPQGRDNPFMATDWKIKMLASEAAANKKSTSGSTVSTVSAAPAAPSVPVSAPVSEGDTTTGI